MTPDAPWELLARHLAADLDGAGQAELRAWLRADARHLQVLTTVTRAWERAGEAAPAPVLFSAAQVAAAWARFQPLMGAAPAAQPRPQQLPGRLRLAVSGRVVGAWLARRGALLVLPLVALAYGFGRVLEPARPVAAHYRSADRPAFVRLPDGSGVWLNARSRLDYLARPDAGPRTARLTGEAYLEVAACGVARPFVLLTNTAQLRTRTGAACNVRAYAAEDSVAVSVRRGQLWLSALDRQTADSLVLLANSRAALHAADAPGHPAAPLLRHPAPNCNYLAWQTDTLRFQDAPVAEVLHTLQANFGTRVAAGPGLNACRFTGTFAHPQVQSLLAVLAAATGSRLVADGHGGFVLAGAGCGE